LFIKVRLPSDELIDYQFIRLKANVQLNYYSYLQKINKTKNQAIFEQKV